MQISLSKKIKRKQTQIVAIWSPGSTGKTFLSVNLSAALSQHTPTALVDLGDNAVHTWLNCGETTGLRDLVSGNPDTYCNPVAAPNLKVYTSNQRSVYTGEVSKLNNIVKSLNEQLIIFDTPREYLKAANVLVLADLVIVIIDQNLHNIILLQKHWEEISNKKLVLNKHIDCSIKVEEILKEKSLAIIPEKSKEIIEGILEGEILKIEQIKKIADFVMSEQKDGG